MITSQRFTIKEASPAAASTTAASTKVIRGLDRFTYFMVDAKLTGGTGGTLDVYLQRRIVEEDGTEHWLDWVHFAQLAAGAAASWVTLTPTANAGAVTVGENLTPVLAAGSNVGGHPGDQVRAVFKTGSGNTAGASQTIHITALGPVLV